MMSAQLQQQQQQQQQAGRVAPPAQAWDTEGMARATPAAPPTSRSASHAIASSRTGAAASASASTLRNRAGESRSPYIQAHRDTPVAWQLLDHTAIERARSENKLIFMNIGFKACHYCRLTTQDSFSNPAVASLLNSAFIPIIVDREERPDIDDVYMNYIQAVNNAGGWPLNLFLTPELEPVFGGTYWPGPGRGDSVVGGDVEDLEDEERLDFFTILSKLQKVWAEQEAKCRAEAKDIVSQLQDFAAEGTLGAKNSLAPARPAIFTQSAISADFGVRDEAVETGTLENKSPVSPASATLIAPRPAAVAAVADLDVDLDQLEEAYSSISRTFDRVNGGFNLAPKFPTPPKLSFLLRLGRFPLAVADVLGGPDEVAHATHMALHTLRKLRDGGLRDHVGSGFARYSATADWSMPHFEKMVADNALLLGVYLDAWLGVAAAASAASTPQLSLTDEFADVVIELAEYLVSDRIRTADGLFATSEASDSFYRKGDRHMREGGYYLWTRREFDTAVVDIGSGASPRPGEVADGELAARVAAAHWNVLEHGNVPRDQDPHDEFINQNVLRVVKDFAELGVSFGISADDVRQILAGAKERLRARRERDRVAPDVDDLAVLSINAIAVSSLARVGAVLVESGLDVDRGTHYLAAAEAAMKEIKSRMWDAETKRLYRTFWLGARGETEALAEDYSFLIEAFLELYEATGRSGHLEWAEELQKKQVELFYDHTATGNNNADATTPHRSSSGGFYATSESAPYVILRLKDGMDTSRPSTNAVCASNLFRLASILNNARTRPRRSAGAAASTPNSQNEYDYEALALETVRAFEVEMLQYPWLFPGLLTSVVTARLGGELQLVPDADEATASRARREFHTKPRAALRALIHPRETAVAAKIPQVRDMDRADE